MFKSDDIAIERFHNRRERSRDRYGILGILLITLVLTGVFWIASPQNVSAASRNVEWGRFQNSEDNNGVVDRLLPTNYNETSLKWARQMETGYTFSFTPPLIIDGNLYTASNQRVLKIDKETGETVAVSSEKLRNTVNYAMHPMTYEDDNDQLYVQLLYGKVACVDAETLDIKWTSEDLWKTDEQKAKYGGQTLSPITYKDGLVYTGTWKNEITDGVYFALDAKTGRTVWEFQPTSGTTYYEYDDSGNISKTTTYDVPYEVDLSKPSSGTDTGSDSGSGSDTTSDTSTSVASTTGSNTESSSTGVKPRGFYWAGCYASENAIVFGSDDGDNNTFGDAGYAWQYTGILYSVDPKTGKLIDYIDGIKGDIRSTIVYNDGYVYFTSKGGWLCKVKLNDDGTFDHDTFSHFAFENAMMTASPVVYNGRIYVGVSGSGGQFDKDGGHAIAAFQDTEYLTGTDSTTESVNASSLLYAVIVPGYPQASAVVTPSAEDSTKVQVYFTHNAPPGGIYSITDDTTLAPGDYKDSENIPEAQKLYKPETEMQQFSLSPITCDEDGNIYIKNDSGYLMAVSTNKAYVEDMSITTGTGEEEKEVTWNTAFESGLLNYTVTAPTDTTTVRVSMKLPEGVSVTINGKDYNEGSGNTKKVRVDSTGDTIRVVAKRTVGDQTYKRTYTMTLATETVDANLAGMAIKGGDWNTDPGTAKIIGSNNSKEGLGYTPNFSADTSEYTSNSYSGDKDHANIWLRTSDLNATVKVFPVDHVGNIVNKGLNEDGTLTGYKNNTSKNIRYAVYWVKGEKVATVKIVVTSQNGEASKEYLVNLIRGDDHVNEVGMTPLVLSPASVDLKTVGSGTSDQIKAYFYNSDTKKLEDVTKDCTFSISWDGKDDEKNPVAAPITGNLVRDEDEDGNETGTSSFEVSANKSGSAVVKAEYPYTYTEKDKDGNEITEEGKKTSYCFVGVTGIRASSPQASLEEGTYYTKQTLTLKAPTAGTEVHYNANLDGSDGEQVKKPTGESTLYTDPLTMGVDGKRIEYRVRTIASGDGYDNSKEADLYYTIDLRNVVKEVTVSGLGTNEDNPGTAKSETAGVTVDSEDVTWSGSKVTIVAKLEDSESARFDKTVTVNLGDGNLVEGVVDQEAGTVTVEYLYPNTTKVNEISMTGISEPEFGSTLTSSVTASRGVMVESVTWTDPDGTVVTEPKLEGDYQLAVKLKIKEGYSLSKDCKVSFKVGNTILEGTVTVDETTTESSATKESTGTSSADKNSAATAETSSNEQATADVTAERTSGETTAESEVGTTDAETTEAEDPERTEEGSSNQKDASDDAATESDSSKEKGTSTDGDDGNAEKYYDAGTTLVATCKAKPALRIVSNGITLTKTKITGLENGTSESDIIKLVQEITANVKLNSGRTLENCPVNWTDTGWQYNPDRVDQQTFEVKGVVKLTENVETDGQSLDVVIQVTVNKGTVEPPTPSIVEGTYTDNQTLVLSSATRGAGIVYTVSGDKETHEGESTVELTAEKGEVESYKIAAYAYKNGVKSANKTFTYTIDRTRDVVPTKVSGVAAEVKASKKQIALSWNQVANADSYKVSYRKAGASKWTTKTTDKNSYTIKSLKANGTYQVKVAGVNKTGTGSYSSVQYSFIAKTTMTIKSGKKALTLKFKKTSKASGYQAQYSLYSNMKSSKTKYTTKTSYAVKSLKAKKYYYVKGAPYKKVSGKKYIGEVSFRKAKTK